ncbi:MAG: ATP-binding protein [candidate division Zixibacteria bacterium]|nr:ATP-binding protein [candidate division Zixibacteria bacterium]
MKIKTFSNKLFILFLLFALVPSIIITASGYFLLMESGSLTGDRGERHTQELTRYYNDVLFNKIQTGINQYLIYPEAVPPIVDFIFMENDNGWQAVTNPQYLSPALIADIIETSRVRPRGFIEHEGQYFQYDMKVLETGEKIYAGLVHDETYKALMETVQTGTARESAGRALGRRYIFFLTTLFIAVSLVMAGAAYLFSTRLAKNIARPLTELSQASIEIAEGNFNQKIKSSPDREIQTLVENFNRMAQRLEQTTSRLAQAERVAAWRQIARRFAHELKNPLQPLLISLYRIEKQLLDNEVYDRIYEPLKAASEELKHLTLLAERFSHLAKLPPPKPETTDLKKLLLSIAHLYEERLARYKFEVRLPEEDIISLVDAAYLREALHNLLQNAIDASPENERIIMSLETDNDTLNLSVTDYGEGMAPQTVTAARLPYFTTREHGTGLGLAIVEKSVNELKGQLLIESRRGRGTKVTISLPYNRG